MNRRRFLGKFAFCAASGLFLPTVRALPPLIQRRLNPPVKKAAVAAVANPTPVGWWKLDDASGTSAIDSSPNSNTGTLKPAAGEGAWGTGHIGGALNFNGTTQYVLLGNISALSLVTGTACVWCYLASAVDLTTSVVVSKINGQTDRNGWSMLLEAYGIEAYFGSASSYQFSLVYNHVVSFPSNTWFHVAMKWNGTNITGYYNGDVKTPISQTVIPTTGTNLAYIGRADVNTGWYFGHGTSGLLDDVRVYSDLLTDAQVLSIYNGTM